MKKRNAKRLTLAIILTALLLIAITVAALAAESDAKEDATVAIEAAFADKRVGQTVSVANDGYIGIPVEVTTYYDYATHGKARSGYNGTVVIIYVVNTNTERVGSKSDTEIIGSMLERGYVVSVLDYLNNDKARTPDLDWSTQTIRKEFLAGTYYTDRTVFPTGKYNDNFIVPAGYDLTYGDIFWEADKHGADGTLEKIVENWNTDFRGWFANTVIYWCNDAGERKATQNAPDGSAPVWLNASGAADENGSYIAAKYTLATDITDCVAKDGTPIDLNLYMHIVYPTTTAEKPLEAVPVIALANSSEYLTTASTSAGLRPQHNGFLFNGYAGVVFDYLYQPMAQSDYYGYYDGRTELGAVTGDRMNYGLHLYNDKRINTAAVRYMRYLTYTQPEKYAFDTDAIGVYGNSKGGWFTFVGEAELREYTAPEGTLGKAELEALMDTRINEYTSKRQFADHDNETRYQNGITDAYTQNGVTIDGGELQPWLTYTDAEGNTHEILSYVNWVYASNGSNFEDITEGHCPVFCALHLQDDFTVTNNLFSEVTANLDIPSMFVIVDLGHTFAYGPEYHYGYDTYDAMFAFANYYLRGDAVSVIDISPDNKTGGIGLSEAVTVRFSGAVTAAEIEKITVTSSAGIKLAGTWSSERGGLIWTFTPKALVGAETYAVTVPADLSGDNGVIIGSELTSVFRTVADATSAGNVTATAVGTFLTYDAAAIGTGDGARVRFYVSNDAANVAELYAIDSYNEAAPEASTVGELIGTVNLTGSGYYEIDATEYIAASGGKAVFLLKAKSSAGTTDTVRDIASSLTGVSLGGFARATAGSTAPDGTKATAMYVTTNVYSSGNKQYPNQAEFYANLSTLMSVSNLFETSDITEDDLGRLYTVTLRVYDTVSRTVQLTLNGAYTATNRVHDFDRVNYNLKTKAGEWSELTFTYRVYEPDYGDTALAGKKLTVSLEPDGNKNSPIYIDTLTVTETVTDIAVESADIVYGSRSDAYKAGTGSPFSIGDAYYNTLYAALSAAVAGDTVVMNTNYTTTASDKFTELCSFSDITLDLNGYDLHAVGGALINAAAKAKADLVTNINIKGGDVYLYDDALVSLSGATAAGKGKVFNINLEGVRIMNAPTSRLDYVMIDPTMAAASGATVNFTVKSSTVDFAKKLNTANPVVIFAGGNSYATVNYKLIGGSIVSDSLTETTLWDAFKRCELYKDASGKYTALIAPESFGNVDVAVMRDDGVAAFTAGTTEGYITTYLAEKSALSTKYGLVPEEYADSSSYPFVIFNENGECIGATSSWLGTNGSGGALGVAKGYVVNAWDGTSYGENPKEAFIVMRRNYSLTSSEYFDNISQTQGTINVDLGGYTLAAGTVTKALVNLDSKGYSGAAGEKVFPTTLIFSNGTMKSYNQGIIRLSCWDSVGGGAIAAKLFTVIYNDVTFSVNDTGVTSISLLTHFNNPTSTTTAAPFYVEYNDCTFDLRTAKSSNAMRLFTTATDGKYVRLNTQVNGGKIVSDDPSKVIPVYEGSDNYGSSVTFGKNADGEYLSFVTLAEKTVEGGSYDSAEGELYFARGEVSGDDVTYTLTRNPYATEYGTIPTEYADADKYPFVVFDQDGNFVGAYEWLFGNNSSSSAMNKARSDMAANVYDAATKTYGAGSKSYIILMRRDYTAIANERLVNIAQIQGTVTLDLGGYTYTQNAAATYPIFHVTSKGWSGSGDEKMFPTTINVKNGEMLVTGSGVIGFNTWETVGNGAIAHKVFTFNFDDVDFGFAEGATSANLLAYYNNTAGGTFTVPGPLNVNCTSCNFDLRTNASSAENVTLFNAACAGGQWVKATFKIYGGTIIADSLDGVTLTATESTYGSTVTFVGGNSGYTELRLSSTAAVPTAEVVTDAGTKRFVHAQTEDSDKIYVLSSLETPYGDIPEAYASVLDYPFAVFNDKGEFVAACSAFYGKQSGASAISQAIYTVLKPNVWDAEAQSYGESAAGAIILMRRDYILGTDEYHDNLAQAQGTVVIDLGGYTLSENPNGTKGRSIFHAVNKRWSASGDAHIFPSTYKIKNGTVLMSKYALVTMESWKSTTEGTTVADKDFTWQFDGVTFGLQAGATTAELIARYSYSTSNTKEQIAPFYFIFNDCVFDLRTVAPSGSFNVLNGSVTTGSLIESHVTVNGCKLLAGSLSGITVYTSNGNYGSTVMFNGLEVELLASATAPSVYTSYPIEGGEGTLVASGSEGGYTVYEIVPSVATEYGYIPAAYADALAYPFAVFKNGEFVFASAIFGLDAKDSALHKAKANGSVILLRRDFVYSESQYNNLSQINGAITIDLGGYTISCEQSGNNPLLYAQKKTQYNSGVTVKNGTILTAKNPIVRYSCWAGSSGGAYTGGLWFNISFDNVTLGAVPGTSPAVLMAEVQQGLAEPTTYASLTLKNCTVDLRGLESTVVFALADDNGVVITEAKLVGGKIIADSLDTITLYTLSPECGSTFTAEKLDGAYTELHLNAGASAPTLEIKNGSGDVLVAQLHGSEGGKDVYVLIDKALADVEFTPMASITLDRDLILNVYVPVADALTALEFAGKAVDLASLERTTVEGIEYYVIRTPLEASLAAVCLPMRATLTSGTVSATKSYTFGTVRYAEIVLAEGSDAEKTLVKNVLSYIRAAYAYFGTEDATAIAQIDAILGEGYDENNKHTDEGSAESVTTGLAGATLVLDATPAIRFYLAEGADASAYEFFIGGNKVKTTSGTDTTGAYIEIDVYAYAMCETVSYTVGGEAGGSYHIASYYAYATEKGDAKLIALVDRMWRYFQSARDYRASVIG